VDVLRAVHGSSGAIAGRAESAIWLRPDSHCLAPEPDAPSSTAAPSTTAMTHEYAHVSIIMSHEHALLSA
jgi:hypothetical protein